MLPQWFIVALIIWLGLCVGTFLNVVIYRLPRGLSVAKPRSRCPSCGTMIKWYQNLPLLSFLLLRGRCAYCRARISWRYPLVEGVTTAFFVVAYFTIGLGVQLPLVWFLFSAFVAIFFIDLDFQIVPDQITLPGIALGIVFAALTPEIGWVKGLIGAVAGGGGSGLVAVTGDLLFKKKSLGGGDIKFAAMVGAFMGWQRLIVVCLGASALALLSLGVSRLVVRGNLRSRQIPFGPYLTIASVVAFFWGDELIRFYLALFPSLQ